MEAYCVKCKAKREIQNPIPEFNAVGTPVTKGKCPECGTSMYRMGSTPAHDGMMKPAKKIKPRSGKLVIVESPAKAKTVGRFLGKGYTVRASIGHVRDLLRSELSVDVENGFTPKYRVPNEKRVVVKELKALAKVAEQIYLATDPDREGEAIAWHLLEAAEIDPKLSHRVVFHEITEPAINEAFANPRDINMNLVDAQQARRILDRLVGYSISPLLWEKVRSRLSAGRVQSVALRLIVEREREIDAFISVEYWSIQAEITPETKKSTYLTKLVKIDDADPDLANMVKTESYLADIEEAPFAINKIKKSERRRKPAAPFITSTLQQEASRRLGYTARRTMMIAQQLYEGLDFGEGGATGLITYMRTDSTNIAEVAQKEAREFIQKTYGSDYLPATLPQYKTRAQSAQEAHEAIRPTSVLRQPEKIKSYLTPEQYKLYLLVWQRFVSSQMESAVYDTLSVDVLAKGKEHNYLFRASGSTVKFPGFLVVYEETIDEDIKPEDGENIRIPAGLVEGQSQRLIRLIPEQHFTQPPPRFTEASLVQILEENGIGRPSTYAPILSTIQQRGYVLREAKRLSPTETGFLVNDLVVDHFPEIVDLGFTANMEEDLDQVAAGEEAWRKVIGEFYTQFEPQVKKAHAEMPVTKSEPEKIGKECPKCGHDLVIRWGRFGKFISCSNFPECRFTEAILEKIGVTCPKDGGDLVLRKTRKGRIFYGCANYPTCDFTNWKRPISNPCPKCSGLMVLTNKKEVQCTNCEESFLIDQIGDVIQE
ncbi:MAG: type I DNA topoisomerase [Anaerolinea sp.]|nr:type I DNA topoisomerase [Anaerolinea sp.]